MRITTFAAVLLAVAPAAAQSSTSYRLSEQVLNAGGNPSQGSVLSSASFRIRLDAIGQAAAGAALASASFHANDGFVSAYPPPGEALNLRFTDATTLAWDPERSVGDYALYRDTLLVLPDGMFGLCWQTGIPLASTSDPEPPPGGQGFFYLVTARNRLREEGTKGERSDGTERANFGPCP